MRKEAMVQLIEAFIKQSTSDKKEKNYLLKLLLDDSNGFIAFWRNEKDENIGPAINQTVVCNTGGKTECLRRMKSFSDFLHRKRVNFDVFWPPIDDIGNRYERLLFILRELQTADETIKENDDTATQYLADLLWVSERTIEEDFSYIMPPYDKYAPRTLFQQSLTINGMKRSKGAVEFASTAHPFFLIENLTSLLVLFESLLEKAKSLPFQEQAMITISRIWKQLTAYAQERISKLLNEFYQDDSEELRLFNKMKDTADAENNAFIKEKTDHKMPTSFLLDALNQRIPCKVEYVINEWERFEWTGTLNGNQIQNGSLLIENGKAIPYEDIISVSLLES